MNNGLGSMFGAWAVAYQFDWGWSFLGPGWFGWGLPPHAEGCRTSLFETKKAAKKAIGDKAERGRVKIVRVFYTVTENRHWKMK